MAKKVKMDYDSNEDSLWLHSGDRIKDSLAIDRFIVDFSPDNKVIGLEIHGAYDYLKGITNGKFARSYLKNMKKAGLGSYISNDVIIVYFYLWINSKEERIPALNLPKAIASKSVKN